jgi:hypothetical protein
MADFAFKLALCYNLASQIDEKEEDNDENNTSEEK